MKTEDIEFIVNGNELAQDFVVSFVVFCHLIDDIVDLPESVNDQRLVKELLSFLNQIVSNPWVKDNIALLWPLIVCGAGSWLDANRWEKSGSKMQKQSVDTLKGQYHEVVWFVAYLCGGLEHQLEVTKRFREYDYETK
jgi:hypothetical protein